MNNLETLLINMEESLPGQESEIQAVLSQVPWARQALHAYVASQRPDLEVEVYAYIAELLAAA